MSYQITITGAGGTFSKQVSAEEALEYILNKKPDQAMSVAAARSNRPKSKPAKKRKPDIFDEEETPKPKIDKEQINRLLKDSDLSPAEIAKKVGCSPGTVYFMKSALVRAGEL